MPAKKKWTGAQIRDLEAAINALPADDPLKREHDKDEVIEQLQSAISQARAKGVSVRSIVEALRQHDLRIGIAQIGKL